MLQIAYPALGKSKANAGKHRVKHHRRLVKESIPPSGVRPRVLGRKEAPLSTIWIVGSRKTLPCVLNLTGCAAPGY